MVDFQKFSEEGEEKGEEILDKHLSNKQQNQTENTQNDQSDPSASQQNNQ